MVVPRRAPSLNGGRGVLPPRRCPELADAPLSLRPLPLCDLVLHPAEPPLLPLPRRLALHEEADAVAVAEGLDARDEVVGELPLVPGIGEHDRIDLVGAAGHALDHELSLREQDEHRHRVAPEAHAEDHEAVAVELLLRSPLIEGCHDGPPNRMGQGVQPFLRGTGKGKKSWRFCF